MSADSKLPETFCTAPGATEKGRDYEKYCLMHFIYTLFQNSDVEDFKILFNAKGYGAFDDLILQIKNKKNEEIVYAMQLKHRDNDKQLTIESLEAEKSKYSLAKHFTSWTNSLQNRSFKLILFMDVPYKSNRNEMVFKGTKLEIKHAKPDLLIDTCVQDENHCYKLEAKENVDEQLNKFLENFYIYTNQAKGDILKTSISRKFQQDFECENDSFSKFENIVTTWYNKVGTKIVINREWIRQTITMSLLLEHYIQPVSSSNFNENTEFFNELASEYNVILVPKEIKKNIINIWQKCDLTVLEANGCKKKHFLEFPNISKTSELKISEKSLILWLLEKCPLIVTGSPQILKAIELSPKKNFVLICSSNKTFPENCSVFHDLSNLDKSSAIYKKLLKMINISVQGRKQISLVELENHQELLQLITTKELVGLFNKIPEGNSLITVGKKEDLPTPYIERNLSTAIIDFKYFQHVEREDQKVVIVISGVTTLDSISEHSKNFDTQKIEDFLKSKKKLKEKTILYCEKECPQGIFDQICMNKKDIKQYHHFRQNEDNKLEWIQSTDSIRDLEDFKIDSFTLSESNLHYISNNINLICANPGMGKSTMVKSLGNNLTKFWTIIIHPSEISSYFHQVPQQSFEDYIDKKICEENPSKFTIPVFELFKKNKKVAYIWDGLDEISDKNFNNVLDIIEGLSSKGYLQWITARFHLQERLEKRFNIFARTLKEFDGEQQDKYIRNRLNKAIKKVKTEEVVKRIKNNTALIQSDEVLGMPLQIYMLTELFIQDTEKYLDLLENTFTLTDLYEHFVNGKFTRVFKEKARIKVDNANNTLKMILESYKKITVKKYEKAALKSLFDEEFKNVNCTPFLEDIKNNCDIFGLITDVSNNMVPTFLHNSYGEFFVASYFYKNYQKIDNLKKILFTERYTNVRFLFDLLMAKDCPAHIAVLYKNIDILRQKENQIQKKDKGGRNPLHLACAWGEQYPLLETTKVDDYHIIDDNLGNSATAETKNQKEIIEHLVNKCDFKELDSLFKMNSLSYADLALCLFPLSEISKKENLKFDTLDNYKDKCTVLYYAVKFDYDHLLNVIQDIPLIEIKRRKLTLLHLCAEYNSKNCLGKLLSTPKYKKWIEKGDEFDLPPIRTACKKGHTEILTMLLDNGADLSNILSHLELACKNNEDEIIKILIERCPPIEENDSRKTSSLMFTAAYKGSYKIVKFLLERIGVKVDVNGRNGTPLFIASQYGHKQTVEVLIKKGADVNKLIAKKGSTPLHIACVGNHFEIIKLLVNSDKIDINTVDNKNHTILNFACKTKTDNEELIRFLLRIEGIDVNKANTKKMTPLHNACQNGNAHIVNMLIRKGVKVDCLGENDKNPLHFACEEGHLEVVEILLETKINLDHPDAKEKRPVDLAMEKNYVEIVELLRNQ